MGYTHNYDKGRVEIAVKDNDAWQYQYIAGQDLYEALQIALMSEQKATIEGKVNEEVVCVGTNSYYLQGDNLEMTLGTFLNKQQVANGSNVVIISDVLAFKLFGSTQAVGNRCKINEHYYDVGGVYKRYTNLMSNIADTGEEKIYVPITSTAVETLKVEKMLFVENELGQDIEKYNLEALGLNEESSYINNQLDAPQKGKNLLRLTWLIVAMIYMAYVIGVIGKAMMTHRLREMNIPVKRFIEYIVVSIVLFYLGIKGFYIKPDIIPPENIFDWSFYWHYFKETCMQSNYFMKLQLSHFTSVYHIMSQTFIQITILEVILCIFVIRYRHKVITK